MNVDLRQPRRIGRRWTPADNVFSGPARPQPAPRRTRADRSPNGAAALNDDRTISEAFSRRDHARSICRATGVLSRAGSA